MLEDIEIRSFFAQFEVKSVNRDTDTEFEGYISVNEVPDLKGDIATKGMFADAFKAGADKLPIFWEHLWIQGQPPIGRTTEAFEDSRGCQIKGLIFPTSLGRDIAIGMKGQAIDSLSYGFRTIEKKAEGPHRRLLKVHPVEASVCNFAVGQLARVTDVKSLSEFHESLYRLPQALQVLLTPEQLEKGARKVLERAQREFRQLADDLEGLLKEKPEKESEAQDVSGLEGVYNRLNEIAEQFRQPFAS